jgi:hypothetical protein
MLPRLSGVSGQAVARVALGAPRSRRRIAAWRYYTEAGLDDDARQTLALQFEHTNHPEFLKLVARDRQLAVTVGVSVLFGRLEQLHWRSRVVEAALYLDLPAAARSGKNIPPSGCGRQLALETSRWCLRSWQFWKPEVTTRTWSTGLCSASWLWATGTPWRSLQPLASGYSMSRLDRRPLSGIISRLRRVSTTLRSHGL